MPEYRRDDISTGPIVEPGRLDPTPRSPFLAGDILFHRPKYFDSDGELDFTQFPVLAAYVQSYPYPEDRPSHHVSVCVKVDGKDRFVDFGAFDGAGYFGQELTLSTEPIPERRSDGTQGQLELTYDVLRHDDEIVANQLARVARNQVPGEGPASQRPTTLYSLPGLLAFAFAMTARLLPEQPDKRFPTSAFEMLRTRLLDRAIGADLVAQAMPGETCTSAVAKAVDSVIGLTIPLPPDSGANGRGELPFSLPDAMAALGRRSGADVDERLIRGPREAVAARAPVGRGPVDILDDSDTPNPDPFDPRPPWTVRSAGFFELTKSFEAALAQAVDVSFEGVTIDELEALGARRREELGTEVEPSSLIISPAMLWDSLLDRGFNEVR